MSLKSRQSNTSNTAPTPTLSAMDYTMGWICARPTELRAATAMLDVIHLALPTPRTDRNAYTLGSIGGHNIVITCLPQGQNLNILSAICTTQMVTTFPSIRIGLVVGVGGGVPASNVHLGNVVVSAPEGQYPGVVQGDFGKVLGDGIFERTGAMSTPPRLLLNAVMQVQAWSQLTGPKIPQYLTEVENKWPALGPQYIRPPAPLTRGPGMASSDASRNPPVHYGLIISGNQPIGNAKIRDEVNGRFGGKVLCFETEAAGALEALPCMVIRGISHYAGETETDGWQAYASSVAAAYAKDLLQHVHPR